MQKLCHPDILQACQRAIAGEKVINNNFLDDIHHLGRKKEQTMLFLECSAKGLYEHHYHNTQNTATTQCCSPYLQRCVAYALKFPLFGGRHVACRIVPAEEPQRVRHLQHSGGHTVLDFDAFHPREPWMQLHQERGRY